MMTWLDTFKRTVPVAAAMLAGMAVRADTIYVDDDNCPGPGNGTEADPYCAIQTAIDSAVDGDEVVVAPGTYAETIDFLGKAITVRCAGPEPCTLESDGTGIGCQFRSAETRASVLDGFTIRLYERGIACEGSSPTIRNCTISSNIDPADQARGAGVRIVGGGPLLTGCTISNNEVGFDYNGYGGGISMEDSSAELVACSIVGNRAWDHFRTLGYGGGAYVAGGQVTLTACSFESNVGTSGAGAYITGAQALFRQCQFTGHPAVCCGSGGGLLLHSSSATVAGCTFTANSVDGDGGGLALLSSSATVTACTFSGNSADGDGLGGALHSQGSTPRVSNCTFFGNSAASGGGVSGGSIVTNCILWNNAPDQFAGPSTVTFSDVQGGGIGIGNIDADPLFVDQDNGDFHLQVLSPCIDAGHNWAVPPDTADLDVDGDTGELTPSDLDGNPRFVHGPTGFHRGCGDPAIVDLGAYEFQLGEAVEVLAGDIYGDGVVNMIDLVAVTVEWGPCPPGCCMSDVDTDGIVGITDLLFVLANWG
jgi:hypothetical protein